MANFSCSKGNFLFDCSSPISLCKFSENIIFETMSNNNVPIEDLTEVKEYQHKDIDFKIANTFVDVKGDSRTEETDNIVFELISSNSIGWTLKTEADYILYCTAVEKLNENTKVPEYHILKNVYRVDFRKWEKYILDATKDTLEAFGYASSFLNNYNTLSAHEKLTVWKKIRSICLFDDEIKKYQIQKFSIFLNEAYNIKEKPFNYLCNIRNLVELNIAKSTTDKYQKYVNIKKEYE